MVGGQSAGLSQRTEPCSAIGLAHSRGVGNGLLADLACLAALYEDLDDFLNCRRACPRKLLSDLLGGEWLRSALQDLADRSGLTALTLLAR